MTYNFRSQRKQNNIAEGKKILETLEPEKYNEVKRLISAIKGPKQKCSGNQCSSQTNDADSEDGGNGWAFFCFFCFDFL